MKPMSIKISFSVTLQPSDIDDIICTAFEGGITYWCYNAQSLESEEWNKENNIQWLHETISRGGDIVLSTDEGDYILNRENLYKGIRIAIKENIISLIDDENERGGKCIDTSEIDADIADAIIQYALFGKLVYA